MNEQLEIWCERAEELANLPDVMSLSEAERQTKAEQLKDHVVSLFHDGDTRLTTGGTIPLWPGVTDDDWGRLRKATFSGENLEVSGSREASRALRRSVRLSARLGRMSLVEEEAQRAAIATTAKCDTNRQQYGAKHANLQSTEAIARGLNSLLGQNSYSVPGYIGVPATLYDQSRKYGLSQERLQPYVAWVSKNDADGYLVRSSAVFSEDANQTTAAGVYESVFVSPGRGLSGLHDAIQVVYESTTSSKALAYQGRYGITQEKMGIVLQKNVASDTTTWGMTNSVVPGIPMLQEVYLQRRKDTRVARALFYKGLTILDVAWPHTTYTDKVDWRQQYEGSEAAYFTPDTGAMNAELSLRAAILSIFSEYVYGCPVQQEFLDTGGWDSQTYIVQTRPLPDSFYNLPETFRGFPKGESLATGRALGIANGVAGRPIDFDELREGEIGGAKPILVMDSNFTKSDISPADLEKVAAAIVISDHVSSELGAKGLHVETLCAELNVPCSFSMSRDMSSFEIDRLYRKLMGTTELTVYMDGLESRVYGHGM